MKHQEKRVVMLSSTFPFTSSDNNPRFVLDLAKNLNYLGWWVDVISPNIGTNKRKVELEGIGVIGFDYFFPRGWQVLNKGSMASNIKQSPWLIVMVPFFMLAMYVTLRLYIKKNKPSLVHAHWWFPQGLVAVLAAGSYIPVIITGHGSDVEMTRKTIWRKLFTFTAKKTKLIALVSTSLKKHVDKLLVDIANEKKPRVVVAPMGIFSYSNRRRTLTIDLAKNPVFKVLYVGRLSREKGCDILLHAILAAQKSLSGIRIELTIVGDGQEKENLLEQVGAWPGSLAKQIHFVGWKNHHELCRYYLTNHILVAPSRHEGFGLVAAEALSMGLPVVASSAGGFDDLIVDGKMGLRFQKDDVVSLSGAIIKAVVHYNDLAVMTDKGRQIAKKYTWPNVGRTYNELYKRLVKT